jgi:hypothetical protein
MDNNYTVPRDFAHNGKRYDRVGDKYIWPDGRLMDKPVLMFIEAETSGNCRDCNTMTPQMVNDISDTEYVSYRYICGNCKRKMLWK